MESGKISSWKVKQGDKFSAGDVLLTVETDKGQSLCSSLARWPVLLILHPFVAAEVDVEAQDDGVMGKIIVRLWHWICPILRKLIIIYISHARQYDEKESSITVGKTIALLAEEGDDISNLSIPESASASSSSSSSSKSSTLR